MAHPQTRNLEYISKVPTILTTRTFTSYNTRRSTNSTMDKLTQFQQGNCRTWVANTYNYLNKKCKVRVPPSRVYIIISFLREREKQHRTDLQRSSEHSKGSSRNLYITPASFSNNREKRRKETCRVTTQKSSKKQKNAHEKDGVFFSFVGFFSENVAV